MLSQRFQGGDGGVAAATVNYYGSSGRGRGQAYGGTRGRSSQDGGNSFGGRSQSFGGGNQFGGRSQSLGGRNQSFGGGNQSAGGGNQSYGGNSTMVVATVPVMVVGHLVADKIVAEDVAQLEGVAQVESVHSRAIPVDKLVT